MTRIKMHISNVKLPFYPQCEVKCELQNGMSTLPATTIAHFELKPQIIHLLPTFYGLDRENPYMHVKDFLEICVTCKFQNFTDDSGCLRLFPFSLKDKAKAWLNSLSPGSITS